ncbi:MAG: type II toxin-antitoxin system RelE/ParE family toxin [Desulfuromusa sp.]
MVKYRLTPAAKNDLLEIWQYTIKAWGHKRAKQYLFDIETKLELLAMKPELGRVRPEINHNYFSFPASSHIIYYLKAGDYIQIIAILHQRMDIERRLNRCDGGLDRLL